MSATMYVLSVGQYDDYRVVGVYDNYVVAEGEADRLNKDSDGHAHAEVTWFTLNKSEEW